MQTSLAALGFFPKTRFHHWPGLAIYLMGWAAFKLGGFRLSRERTLRFKDFVVIADVEGRSGLAFLPEILVKRIYDLAPLRPDKPVQVIFDAGANCDFFAQTRCSLPNQPEPRR